MASLQASFLAASGESQGKLELPEIIFGGAGSRRVLHEVVVALQANRRRGTSSTLTRGNVRGGGHKPWKQKGTGNARQGSIRSPLWRKGGIIFGPHPRSYRVEVDAAKKLLALQTALVGKAKAERLHVIGDIQLKDGKTRGAAELIKKTALSGRLMVVLDKKTPAVEQAMRNIPDLRLVAAAELNALDLMSAGQVLLTQSALEALTSRFPKGGS